MVVSSKYRKVELFSSKGELWLSDKSPSQPDSVCLSAEPWHHHALSKHSNPTPWGVDSQIPFCFCDMPRAPGLSLKLWLFQDLLKARFLKSSLVLLLGAKYYGISLSWHAMIVKQREINNLSRARQKFLTHDFSSMCLGGRKERKDTAALSDPFLKAANLR